MDVSERLDVEHAQLRVLETRQPKSFCRRWSGAVIQALAPEHVVPGHPPTEALIAQVMVAKLPNDLPSCRHAETYVRQWISLDWATLGNWVWRATFHLKPIINLLQKHLKYADRIFTDETHTPVL